MAGIMEGRHAPGITAGMAIAQDDGGRMVRNRACGRVLWVVVAAL